MKKSIYAFFGAALLLTAAFVWADNTKVWRQDRFEDFDKGTPSNVSMRSDGVLLLARQFRAIGDPQLTYIWALVEDSKGRLYAAGGSPGKLVRLSPGTGDAKIETVFTAKELEIHALEEIGRAHV